jgi:ribonucleoside-diphosphate reductase beta chain
MRLFQKSKRLGIWDPMSIDLTEDKKTWAETDEEYCQAVIGSLSLFQAGEEGVTLDLLPLIMAIAREGRIEEEIYLTSFLWEEAKHLEFFRRYLNEVADATGDLSMFHTKSYKKIFYEELPRVMWELTSDPSPENQVIASVTYNMIVEGVLAETGYFGFFYDLETRGENPLPGLLEGLGHIRRDESRHIAYGIFLISRLMSEHPHLWEVAQARMKEMLPLAMAFIQERLDYQLELYGRLPNDMEPSLIMQFAAGQYQKRLQRLDRARKQSLEEVERIALETAEDAA